MNKRYLFVVLFLLLPAFSKLVIVNSQDWKFVLLSMEYAQYSNSDIVFLTDEVQADIIAKNLAGSDIVVFEDKRPILRDFDAYAKNLYGVKMDRKDFSGYADLQEYLLRIVEPKTLFIASTLEPENTIISVPLAYKQDGIVLFRSDSLFSRLTDFENIYLVGGVQRDFRKELLSVANLLGKEIQIIDEGSPYKNSLVLLDLWGKTDKVFMSTGEFLHPTIFSGNYPLVLIGQGTYPDGLIDTLKNEGVKTLLVVGTDLMGTARKLRDDSNKELGVLVEYGETYTAAGYAGTIYALTVYRLPLPRPNITISDVFYDQEQKKLYVKFSNKGDGLSYTASVLRIQKNGRTLNTITDQEVFRLWPGDDVVRVYSLDLTPYGLNGIDVNINAKYGRYEGFLVNVLDITRQISITSLLDKSVVSLEKATYDGKWLKIYVKNTGGVVAYVGGEVYLLLDGKKEAFPLTGARISSGKTGTLKLRIRMDEQEFADNEFVEVFLKYGSRQDLLIKNFTQKVLLEKVKIRLELVLLPVGLLILVLLIMGGVSRLQNRRYYRVGRRVRRLRTRVYGPSKMHLLAGARRKRR